MGRRGVTGAGATTLRGRRVVIVVDHPVRDLAGLVLVALELCQRGATCFFVPMNLQEREIWSLAPDFVLLNYMRRTNEEFARRMRSAGVPFGVLDTEGGIWPTPESYSEMLWTDRELLLAANPVCMWGPRLAEHLLESGLVAPEQVRVTGCPRFDYYHPRWRSVFSGNGGAERAGRPRLLLNTRFGTVNSQFVSEEANRNQLESELGWPRTEVDLLVETERRSIDGMIVIARRLAADYPEALVVLRPHPFEDPAVYRRGLAGIANATVEADGPVQSAILGAAAVIQRGCTTAMEASLAGIPALSPIWLPIPHEYPMTEAVSIPCESAEMLSGTVRQILEGRYADSPDLAERRRGVIHDWFFEIDGMAHRRVADAIGACLVKASAVDAALCRHFLYGAEQGGSQGRDPIGSRLRRALRLSPNFSFRKMRTVVSSLQPKKAFAAAEVEALLRTVTDLRIRAGEPTLPVFVSLAKGNGEYSHGFRGHAVRLRTN
jgi:surface carbohydrate biosynthesis protein